MPELKNIRHELFALRVAAGEMGASAYRSVFPRCASGSAVQASKLLTKANVAARVDEVRKLHTARALTKALLDLDEKRKACADIVRVNLAALINDDGSFDLEALKEIPPWCLQKLKVKETETVAVKGDTVITTIRRRIEIDLVDKLGAMRLDTTLAGPENPPPEDESGREASNQRARAFLRTLRGHGGHL